MRTRIAPLVRGQDVRLLAASAATGVVVAMIVALFDALTVEVVYEWLLDQELSIQAAAPFLGAVGAVLILRSVGFNASASTSDEYVRAFHERNPSIPLREVPGKLAAGITTIGLGGAVDCRDGQRRHVFSRQLLGRRLVRRRKPLAVAAPWRKELNHRVVCSIGQVRLVAEQLHGRAGLVQPSDEDRR